MHVERLDGSFNGYTDAGTTDAEAEALRRVSVQLSTTAAAAPTAALVVTYCCTLSRRPGNSPAFLPQQ